MDFLYEPIEIDEEANALKPLEWDGNEYEDEYVFDDESADAFDQYEEEYEESGLGGWDDLKPFTSFDDESSWSDAL